MNHMQQYLAEEFAEEYHAGHISRRQALKVLVALTGSLLLASDFLAACAPPPAPSTATLAAPVVATTGPATAAPASTAASPTPVPSATAAPTSAPTSAPASPTAAPTLAPGQAPYGTVVPGDPAISAGPATFPGGADTLLGYLARPAGAGPFPVVLVCHENRGLTAHIQDVTRRFGKAGYAALAVDLLSRQGGSDKVGESGAPGALGGITPAQYVADFRSGLDYMQTQAFAQPARLGMVGFCFGGGVTWLVAEAMPELKAAVPFYGPPPPLDQVPKIQAAVLAMYGAADTRITSSEPGMAVAMQAAGKVFDKMIYIGAGHAFFNDTGGSFAPDAARDAWGRTLAWFSKYL